MKIWIVEGYGGDYEDAREWQLKAFFDQTKAEAFAEKLRTGKLVDRDRLKYYQHITDAKYNVFPLTIGDKPKERS